jgi:hypothetical protein
MMEERQSAPAHVGMLQLLNGAHVAGAVSCLAQLGIPDLIESASKSADELASQIVADPEALYRLMRATASVGVLSEGPDGKFSQTPMSTVLRSDATPSLRALAASFCMAYALAIWRCARAPIGPFNSIPRWSIIF